MVKKIIKYIHKLLSSYQPSKIHTISSYIYELISNHVRNTLYMYYMKPSLSLTWCLDVAVMDRNKTYCSTACQVRFQTHFRVQGMLIIEDPTVIMKCRTASHVHLHPYPFIVNKYQQFWKDRLWLKYRAALNALFLYFSFWTKCKVGVHLHPFRFLL